MTNQKFEIRAKFDQHTISVYQAFSSSIAKPAIAHNKLMPPFSYDRMTWIKPSFLWMMYRSDYGQRVGQEHILEIKIKREFWEKALKEAILTTPEKRVYADAKLWRKQLKRARVRVQWDPERSLSVGRLGHKSIQVGITGALAEEYAKKWIVSIEDKTSVARSIFNHVCSGQIAKAEELLPEESIYEVSDEIKKVLGM